MNKSALLLATMLGSGSLISAGRVYAEVLINTNVVAAANTGTTDAWAISDTSGTSYYITNSTVSAATGVSTELSARPAADLYALGTGAIQSTGAAHDVTVVDSSIEASEGGEFTSTGVAISRALHVDGGNGMSLQNANLELTDSEVLGGAGGSITVDLSGSATSLPSADGGDGLILTGTTTVTANDSTIAAGDGGSVDNTSRTGAANGGTGIYISGSTANVTLNLTNTVVRGGDGGTVEQNYGSAGKATGGDALYVASGASVTISGGQYVGGDAGTVAGVTQSGGSALEVNAANVTLAGGTFVGGILFSGTGTSTLALKSTFGDAAVDMTGGTLNVTEWYDGQLSDVNISAGTMNFNGTTAFNLSGDFVIAGSTATSAVANFKSGLTVASGGSLNLGLSTSTVTGSATVQSNSTVLATRTTSLGKIAATDLTIEQGAKWVITDAGTTALNVGDALTLATGSATITNNLLASDVSYVGSNGSAGWLGGIVAVTNVGTSVQGVYGQFDIDEAFGLKGDTSSNLGRALADLTSLVSYDTNSNPSASIAAYNQLTSVATYLSDGLVIATNGIIRTAQATKAVAANQMLYMNVIKSRTRSCLAYNQTGSESAPAGPSGWTSLRSFSDRAESKVSTDGLRSLSDRLESNYGYNQVKDKMDQLETGVNPENWGLPEGWQIWGQGFGSNAKQDDKNGVAGYDATVGGAMLGVDKRMNNLLVGFGGGFAQTTIDGNEQNNSDIDTCEVVAYMAAYGEHAYFDMNLSYAYNSVNTEYESYGYTGSYDAHSLGIYVGGGYGIALTKWMILTPEVSLMATYYSREGYDESSSIGMPTKEYDSYDQLMPVATAGATLVMPGKFDLTRSEIAIQPEFRIHVMHDFNADPDAETYSFANGTYDIDTPLLATEEELIKVGAGVRMFKWSSDKTEIGFDIDGVFADGYNAYTVSGKLIHRF